ncbi:NAD(P)H-dependent oxidoreductase [Ramlibacter sp. AW1]|uniref:NAD(P)H-dependent oxidoreductase n=1 Tax=Ramlibacter aurantiacus TaxID=2801330 RepID=A0A937D5W1_9BURK|nr:NAD(P)H-dependent oxidoreductase [Ramlibacter aurantiacus]
MAGCRCALSGGKQAWHRQWPRLYQDSPGARLGPGRSPCCPRLRAHAVWARVSLRGHGHRSIPGVLKNAIDHASRSYGQGVWAGKPAGVIGISVGALGTSMAQQHLRNVRAYLDIPMLGQPGAFVQNKPDLLKPDGTIGIEDTRKFLQGWMDRYVAFVRHRSQPL